MSAVSLMPGLGWDGGRLLYSVPLSPTATTAVLKFWSYLSNLISVSRICRCLYHPRHSMGASFSFPPTLLSRTILLWVLASLASRQCASAQTVSIGKDTALTEVRGCVSRCVTYNDFLGYIHGIQYYLDCQKDGCLCRDQLRSSASFYFSSCIFTDNPACADSSDYADAVSIFDEYCHFTAPASTTVSIETSTTTYPSATTAHTPKSDSTAASTKTTKTSSEQTSSLSSEVLLTVMSIMIVGAVFLCCSAIMTKVTLYTTSRRTSTTSTPEIPLSIPSTTSHHSTTEVVSSNPPSASTNGTAGGSGDGGHLDLSDKVNIAVGTVVPILVALGGLFGWWYRTRRKRAKQAAVTNGQT